MNKEYILMDLKVAVFVGVKGPRTNGEDPD